MRKALLISLLAATILIPLFAARGGSVRSAARRSVVATAIFCVLYWVGLVWVYPTLPASGAKGDAPTQE
jgi:hypothetical protein